MGATCGRREREADAENEEERSSHVSAVATVEGTLIHGMPVAFAGCRRNVGLGRSARECGARPIQAVAPATTGVLWKNEEGNVVSVRQAHALFVVTPNKRPHARGHVLRSVQRPVHVLSFLLGNGETRIREGERSSRYRGRANLRKQEEPATGSTMIERTKARLAAYHRSAVKRRGPRDA
jgi:hypothetical protein